MAGSQEVRVGTDDASERRLPPQLPQRRLARQLPAQKHNQPGQRRKGKVGLAHNARVKVSREIRRALKSKGWLTADGSVKVSVTH